MENKDLKFVCIKCGANVSAMLNEATGQIEPPCACSFCGATDIYRILETHREDNRQLLNG